MYLAAKNGHLSVVKFLLQQQANPNIESSPDGKGTIWEKPLHVATRYYLGLLKVMFISLIRWGHLSVVKCLLECTTYTQVDLKKAIKNAEKPDIKKEILDYYSAKFGRRPLLFLLCGCG